MCKLSQKLRICFRINASRSSIRRLATPLSWPFGLKHKGKAPPFGEAFLAGQSKLTVLTGIGSLPLTARILLLLAGLLAAAFLLTRLLARVLVLLARVLVLISH